MPATARHLALLCAALAAGCGSGGPPAAPAEAPAATAPAAAAGTEVVPAAPEAGFNYSYLLRLPSALPPGSSANLLVEPNNSGRVSDDPEVHLAAARELSEKAVGGRVCGPLGVPLLVPVFPRTEALYAHILNRRTLDVADGPVRRLDLQLLAMIADARRRLAGRGVAVPERVLLTGFSASGAFVNRFTALHPGAVRAVAAGAVNGMLVIPKAELGGEPLPFPLGVADVERFTGRPFDAEAWRRVPQFLYMGALDENDAVRFDDAYTAGERAVIYRRLGERMQPDRWERCQGLYREAGAAATFRTFEGVGHATNGKVHGEIVDFFRAAAAATPD